MVEPLNNDEVKIAIDKLQKMEIGSVIAVCLIASIIINELLVLWRTNEE